MAKKKKLSPALKAWNMCRVRLGVELFKKMTAAQKREVRKCVDRETGQGTSQRG